MKKIVIWGASGHARVVADILRVSGAYEIAGFLDDDPARRDRPFCGATILGGSEALAGIFRQGIKDLIVAVGDCEARWRLSRTALSHGYALASAMHPGAIIAQDASVGSGTVVCAGAVINPAVKIGSCVIVNTGANIDHECFIHDGVHIGPGASLGGLVTVGRQSWIGIGSTIRDRISIGDHAVIGAGSVVVADIPDRVLAYGIPAKPVRKFESGFHGKK